MTCVILLSQAVVFSKFQTSEGSRVGLEPKPGIRTEGAVGVEWLDKAERNRSTKS